MATTCRRKSAQDLLESFRQTCFTEDGDVSSLISAIDELAYDAEHSVRAIVMEQLPQIALFCHEEGPHLDHVLPQHILPHIVKFLTDKFTQVRKTSQAGLLLLVERGIIAPSQVEEHVLPVVLEFTTPAAHEDYRTEITQFMSKLAPLVGKDITIKCYLERFCHLCNDKLFQVRKVCASNIGELASVVGFNITENVLVSHFRALCQDEVWGVRKGCADTITLFSGNCTPTIRKGVLTDAFVELLKDSSRWVRVSACQSLGPFITTFLSEEGTPPSTPDSVSEAETTFLAAYRYKFMKFEAERESDSPSADDRNSTSNLSSSVIPSSAALLVPRTNFSAIHLLEKAKSICEDESLDQNQNTKIISATNTTTTSSQPDIVTANFTVIPMEIDDDVTSSEQNNVFSPEKRLYSNVTSNTNNNPSNNRSPARYQLSFEEKRKLAYEQNGNTLTEGGDAIINENVDVIMSNHVLEPENCNENIINSSSTSASTTDTVDQSQKEEELKQDVNDDQQFNGNHHSQQALESLSESPSIGLVDSKKEEEQNNISNPEEYYDTWQYWRDPIPEIDLDTEMLDKSLNNNINKRDATTIESSSSSESISLVDDKPVFPKGDGDAKMEVDNFLDEFPGLDSTSSSSSSSNHGGLLRFTNSPRERRLAVAEENSAYNTPDIHRSYMNLFCPTTREQSLYGFESLKLGDGYDDDDSDEQLNTSYPFGDEYSAHTLWGNRNCRPRLLTDLPKTIPVVEQNIVPGVLLEHFTSLCQQSKDHHNMDSEILSFCVFNFPAVVLTLGPQNWSLVRDCYEALACSVQWKIRYTLASSLHEIANILGPELAERDLLPFYNATTKDLDEVRIGILRNLADFIRMLGGEAQRRCLETLDRFSVTENFRNWRFRLELADQLRKVSEIYEADEIFKHLCPLTMDLLLDRVAEVRKSALNVIPYLVTRLNYAYADNSNDPSFVKDFLEHLVKTLGESEVWVRRQAFANLAGQLIEIGAMSPPQFAQHILPALLALRKDTVPNVRLKVAQSIVLNIMNQEYFCDPSNPSQELLHTALLELQEDEDRDVRYASQLSDDEEEFIITTETSETELYSPPETESN